MEEISPDFELSDCIGEFGGPICSMPHPLTQIPVNVRYCYKPHCGFDSLSHHDKYGDLHNILELSVNEFINDIISEIRQRTITPSYLFSKLKSKLLAMRRASDASDITPHDAWHYLIDYAFELCEK